MYCGVALRHLVVVCLIWLKHEAGADSLNNTDNGEDLAEVITLPPLIYPQPRIVGGRGASEGQFPYQVSLRSGVNSICGGSIISANYVVTAAHCVTSGSPPKATAASRFSIRAGSRLVNSGGQIVGVSQVIVHPAYSSFSNDIALLKLSSPLKLDDRVKAIALASQAPPTGAQVVTSGWGRLRNGDSTPQVLQYNTFTALTQADCRRRGLRPPTSVICLAHTRGNGVCSGDSGGPAVYKNQLVGVTNYSVGGCGSRYPDGYANVAYHLSWLKRNSDL